LRDTTGSYSVSWVVAAAMLAVAMPVIGAVKEESARRPAPYR
jgi:hypothetical protein